jgi:prolyl 4-hydroxylase
VLGCRLRRGHTFAPDAVRALRLFERAAAAGHPSAALEAARLSAELCGAAPAPGAAPEDLLVGLPEPDPDRAIPRPAPSARVLSWAPRVFLLTGMASDEERLHLTAVAAPLLRPALVVSRDTGRPAVSAGRRSGIARLGGPFRDPVVAAFEERIALHSRFPLACGEALVVLCYGPGDEYRPHHDWFDPNDPARREVLARGGQRLASFITWLSPVAGGGATDFPAAGLSVDPDPGSALFFFNCHPDGTPDPASGHAGAPVTAGGKWVATRWLRERPVR